MASPQARPMSFDDLLAWEQRQPTRHEFVDGNILAMAGGSQAHNLIQGNLYATVREKLRGGPYRPFTSDMLARTGRDNGRYPDMTIACGAYLGTARISSRPTVVFEVLSDNTQREDRTRKLADYDATPTIAQYVLVQQEEPLAYVYSRAAHGGFSVIPVEVSGIDGEIDLPSVGISLAMADVYEGIVFAKDDSAA